MRRFASRAAVGAALLVASAAQAHITLTPATAEAGHSFAGAFRVGHGCAGSATKGIRVVLPPAVTSARPQAKPGWTIKVEHAVGPEGKDRVAAIVWSGGLVPDDEYDDFGVMLGLPAKAGPVFIPVVQTCEAGESRWDEIPSPGTSLHSLKRPAAVVEVIAPPPLAVIGGIEVREGWVRAAPNSAPAAAAYLVLHNGSKQADRLVSVSTPAAARAELHNMRMDGGVMRMRALEHGLDLPAGGDAALAPGGNHVMLFGPAAPLEPGGKVELTLVFEHAGRVTVTLPVRSADDSGGGGGEHHHGGMR